MISLFQSSSNTNSFKVRTALPGCSVPLQIRLELGNEETLETKSVVPSSALYDNYGFLSVSAPLGLTPNCVYSLIIWQVTGSQDCQQLYRGQVTYISGSGDSTNIIAKPFESYVETQTNYITFRND